MTGGGANRPAPARIPFPSPEVRTLTNTRRAKFVLHMQHRLGSGLVGVLGRDGRCGGRGLPDSEGAMRGQNGWPWVSRRCRTGSGLGRRRRTLVGCRDHAATSPRSPSTSPPQEFPSRPQRLSPITDHASPRHPPLATRHSPPRAANNSRTPAAACAAGTRALAKNPSETPADRRWHNRCFASRQ